MNVASGDEASVKSSNTLQVQGQKIFLVAGQWDRAEEQYSGISNHNRVYHLRKPP